MPRIGITYLDVAQTATKLIEQNIHPTIEEIRKVLRTGSNSTINRHLRQWREKQGNQIEAEKGLPETLLIAVKGIYSAIQEEATHKILTIETETKNKLTDFKVQAEQLIHQNNTLKQNNCLLENKINEHQIQEIESQKVINNLNQKIDRKTSENQLLQERIDDKNSEIERIAQQLKHAQHNLEHYREAIKQERDAEKQRYELKIKGLEQEAYQHFNAMSAAQNKISAFAQKSELLENDKNKVEASLQEILKTYRDHELLMQRNEINYDSLNKVHDKIKSEHQSLVIKSENDKNVINEMEKNVERLLERVSIMECNLKKADDKIEMLANKNLFLLQEKTELLSQLKTMRVIEQLN
jgi:chromosome segregation ATPase